MVIELVPEQWITYDGTRLEAALRGVEHHERLAKPTRNRTDAPDGWEMEYL